MNDRKSGELWRTKDACTYLNISRTTFHRYRKNKDFPSGIQLSRQTIVWDPNEIIAWVESCPKRS